MKKLLLLLLLGLLSPSVGANVFQCFYEDGSHRYSDNNCPDAVAQVDLSLKGSWMMRRPKGSNCKVSCDSYRCACRGTRIDVSDRKDAVLEALDKLPKAHLRQRTALGSCRKCPRKRRRSVAVNACDIVVYQTVIKQFFKGASAQVAADLKRSESELALALHSCDGPNAAKPKAEVPYGEKLSCKEQTAFRTAVTVAKLRHNRAQREFAQLTAGATVLELPLPARR